MPVLLAAPHEDRVGTKVLASENHRSRSDIQGLIILMGTVLRSPWGPLACCPSTPMGVLWRLSSCPCLYSSRASSSALRRSHLLGPHSQPQFWSVQGCCVLRPPSIFSRPFSLAKIQTAGFRLVAAYFVHTGTNRPLQTWLPQTAQVYGLCSSRALLPVGMAPGPFGPLWRLLGAMERIWIGAYL